MNDSQGQRLDALNAEQRSHLTDMAKVALPIGTASGVWLSTNTSEWNGWHVVLAIAVGLIIVCSVLAFVVVIVDVNAQRRTIRAELAAVAQASTATDEIAARQDAQAHDSTVAPRLQEAAAKAAEAAWSVELARPLVGFVLGNLGPLFGLIRR